MLSQAIQQILLSRPLEKEVPDIVRKYGGSLYVPSPATCFQDSAGTTLCTVDSVVGLMLDTSNPVPNRNLFKNTGFLGGTSGSPGGSTINPFISSAPSGITRTLAYGITADGKPYVDITYSGTNTAGNTQYPGLYSVASSGPAVSGQTYTVSAELALMGGSWPTAAAAQISEYSSASAYLVGSSTSIKTTVTNSTLTKVSHTRTLNNASTAYMSGYPITFAILNNEVVNFTVRVVNPQLEVGSVVTNFVPNTYMGYSANQIQGNHASQGTAGYKPILRGAVKNLLKYSNDLSNSAWLKTNISISGSLATRTSTSASNYLGQGYSLPIGSYVTLQLKAKASSLGNRLGVKIQGTYPDRADAVIDLINGTVIGTGSTNNYTNVVCKVTSADDGYYLVVLSCIIVNTAMSQILIGPTDSSRSTTSWEGASTILSDCYIKDVQLEVGLRANSYVPTTSTPASSSYGPYWLDFDGTDDRLQLGNVPFQMSNDQTVIASGMPLAASKPMIALAASSTSESLPYLGTNASSYLGYEASGGGTVVTAFDTVSSLGINSVLSAVKSSDAIYIYKNSRAISSGTTSGTYTTATNAMLGGSGRSTVVSYKGSINFAAVMSKPVTQTDMRKIEKYAAKLSGAQL